MKNMKKFTAMLLAVIMVLGMALSVSADETETGPYSVTVKNAEGHTYRIYQIFTGDISVKNGKEILANLKYGTDYVPEGKKVGDLVPEKDYANLEATATTIQKTGEGKELTYDNENKTATITGLVAGYYMIVDETETGALPNGDNKSAVMFQVVGDTEITSKHTGTTIEKKVQDINDSTGVYTVDSENNDTTWIDSADYDIGDTVPFQSTANFEGLDNYKEYKVVFTDTMSKGLEYNKDMTVWIGDQDVTKSFDIQYTSYTATGDAYAGGTLITATCDNIKALANGNNAVTIVLKYTATLKNTANIGALGNPNKIKVSTNADGSGATPEDVAIVFTYKTVVNKVDPSKNPLTGAEFTLEKFVKTAEGTEGAVTYKGITGMWQSLALVVTNGTTFTYEGLDDGYYRITETKAPVGYNKLIDSIYFTVTAEHEVLSDNPQFKNLNVSQGEADKKIGIVEVKQETNEITSTIVNKQGAQLPETGGMGTTMFYAVGAVLVLAAVVLLVTKRRMRAE